MFLLPAAAMGGTHLTMLEMVWKNLFPVLLGNAGDLGGGCLGLALNPKP